MEWILVPDLFCPFASEVNEHAEAVQEETGWWASSFGLFADERARRVFASARMGRLAARTHPRLGAEELRLVSDFYAWMFLRDDERDDTEVGRRPGLLSEDDRRFLDLLVSSAPQEAGLGRATGGTVREHDPMARALADLVGRLDSHGRRMDDPFFASKRRRFARVLEEHLTATLWEAGNRAAGVPPNLASYLRMRPLTGGLETVTELTEMVGGHHLPYETRRHPVVARLTLASHRAVCFANDLISLPKELLAGEVNNLVIVLRVSERLSAEEAVRRAAAMHDEEVAAFLEAEQRLDGLASAWTPAARRVLWFYVESLRDRMGGVLHWSRESARYRVGATREVELKTG